MYKGREYKGIHKPLVTAEPWATAREVAMTNTVAKGEENRIETVAEFKGILKCGHCGGAMVPKFAVKHGKRYIYYKCQRDEIRDVSSPSFRHLGAEECPMSWITSNRQFRRVAEEGEIGERPVEEEEGKEEGVPSPWGRAPPRTLQRRPRFW